MKKLKYYAIQLQPGLFLEHGKGWQPLIETNYKRIKWEFEWVDKVEFPNAKIVEIELKIKE